MTDKTEIWSVLSPGSQITPEIRDAIYEQMVRDAYGTDLVPNPDYAKAELMPIIFHPDAIRKFKP